MLISERVTFENAWPHQSAEPLFNYIGNAQDLIFVNSAIKPHDFAAMQP